MDNFWGEFLQNVLISVCVPLAVSGIFFLIALGKKKWEEAKALKPDLFAELEWIANLVVDAAEEAGAKEIIEDKEKWAIDLAEKFLAAKGLVVDLDMVVAAIKASVKAMRDDGKEMPSLKSKKMAKEPRG